MSNCDQTGNNSGNKGTGPGVPDPNKEEVLRPENNLPERVSQKNENPLSPPPDRTGKRYRPLGSFARSSTKNAEDISSPTDQSKKTENELNQPARKSGKDEAEPELPNEKKQKTEPRIDEPSEKDGKKYVTIESADTRPNKNNPELAINSTPSEREIDGIAMPENVNKQDRVVDMATRPEIKVGDVIIPASKRQVKNSVIDLGNRTSAKQDSTFTDSNTHEKKTPQSTEVSGEEGFPKTDVTVSATEPTQHAKIGSESGIDATVAFKSPKDFDDLKVGEVESSKDEEDVTPQEDHEIKIEPELATTSTTEKGEIEVDESSDGPVKSEQEINPIQKNEKGEQEVESTSRESEKGEEEISDDSNRVGKNLKEIDDNDRTSGKGLQEINSTERESEKGLQEVIDENPEHHEKPGNNEIDSIAPSSVGKDSTSIDSSESNQKTPQSYEINTPTSGQINENDYNTAEVERNKDKADNQAAQNNLGDETTQNKNFLNDDGNLLDSTRLLKHGGADAAAGFMNGMSDGAINEATTVTEPEQYEQNVLDIEYRTDNNANKNFEYDNSVESFTSLESNIDEARNNDLPERVNEGLVTSTSRRDETQETHSKIGDISSDPDQRNERYDYQSTIEGKEGRVVKGTGEGKGAEDGVVASYLGSDEATHQELYPNDPVEFTSSANRINKENDGIRNENYIYDEFASDREIENDFNSEYEGQGYNQETPRKTAAPSESLINNDETVEEQSQTRFNYADDESGGEHDGVQGVRDNKFDGTKDKDITHKDYAFDFTEEQGINANYDSDSGARNNKIDGTSVPEGEDVSEDYNIDHNNYTVESSGFTRETDTHTTSYNKANTNLYDRTQHQSNTSYDEDYGTRDNKLDGSAPGLDASNIIHDNYEVGFTDEQGINATYDVLSNRAVNVYTDNNDFIGLEGLGIKAGSPATTDGEGDSAETSPTIVNALNAETYYTNQEENRFDYINLITTSSGKASADPEVVNAKEGRNPNTAGTNYSLATSAVGGIDFDSVALEAALREEFGDNIVDGWSDEGTYTTEAKAALEANPNLAAGIVPRVQESTNFSFYSKNNSTDETASVFTQSAGSTAIKNSRFPTSTGEFNVQADGEPATLAGFIGLGENYGDNSYAMPNFTSEVHADGTLVSDGLGLSTSRDIKTGEGMVWGSVLNAVFTGLGVGDAISSVSGSLSNITDIIESASKPFTESEIGINDDYLNLLRREVLSTAPALLNNIVRNSTIEGSEGLGDSFGQVVNNATNTAQTFGAAMNQPAYFIANKIREVTATSRTPTETKINRVIQGGSGKYANDPTDPFGSLAGADEPFDIVNSYASRYNSFAQFRDSVISSTIGGGGNASGTISIFDADNDKNVTLAFENKNENYPNGDWIDILESSVGLSDTARDINIYSRDIDVGISWMPPVEYQAYSSLESGRLGRDEAFHINDPRTESIRKASLTQKPFSAGQIAQPWFDSYNHNERNDIRFTELRDQKYNNDFEINGQQIPYPSNHLSEADGETRFIIHGNDAETGVAGDPIWGLTDALDDNTLIGDAENKGLMSSVVSGKNEFYIKITKSNTIDDRGGNVYSSRFGYHDVTADDINLAVTSYHIDPHLMHDTDSNLRNLTDSNREGKDRFALEFGAAGKLLVWSDYPSGSPNILPEDDDPNSFNGINQIEKQYFNTGTAISDETRALYNDVRLSGNRQSFYDSLRFTKDIQTITNPTDINPDANNGDQLLMLDPHFVEVNKVDFYGPSSSDNRTESLVGKDLYFETLKGIEPSDDKYYFNISQFDVKTGGGSNLYRPEYSNILGNATNAPDSNNLADRKDEWGKISHMESRSDRLHNFYDELMVNTNLKMVQDYGLEAYVEDRDGDAKRQDFIDPHLSHVSVKYNDEGDEPARPTIGKDVFANNLVAANKFSQSGEKTFSWAEMPTISDGNYVGLLGTGTVGNDILANETEFMKNGTDYHNSTTPKNSLVVVEGKYRAKLTGVKTPLERKDVADFDDFRFAVPLRDVETELDDEENVPTSGQISIRDLTPGSNASIVVNFSNSTTGNKAILANVPIQREYTRFTNTTAEGTPANNDTDTGGRADIAAFAAFKNHGIPSGSFKSSVKSSDSEPNRLLPLSTDFINVVEDSGSFIETELGIVRSTGEQSYTNRDNRKREIIPSFYPDKETITYEPDDDRGNHSGIITATELHDPTVAFNTDDEDNNTRAIAYGTGNSQINYRGGDDSNTTLSPESKGNFYTKIRDKFEQFVQQGSDDRRNGNEEYGCGFLAVIADPSKAVNGDNLLYQIPMQFNPEITGESRSANWSQQTAIGRTNEHFIWANTGSRTIQFKTTYAIIAPDDGDPDWFKDENKTNIVYDAWGKEWTETKVKTMLQRFRSLLLPGSYANVDNSRLDGNRLSPPVITIFFGDYTMTEFEGSDSYRWANWIATDLNIDPRLEGGYTNSRNPRIYDITMTLKEMAPNWRSFQLRSHVGVNK